MNGIEWDESQVAAWDAATACVGKAERGTPSALSILGAPGTGKTALLESFAASTAGAGKRVALLTQDRRSARDSFVRIAGQVGTMTDSLTVSSLTAFAYHIVQEFAEQTGRRRPELISGPDEDALLRDILADGQIDFGSLDSEALALPAFRAELRNLFARAEELGLDPSHLEALGQGESVKDAGGAFWPAAARVWSEYQRRVGDGADATPSLGLLEAERLNHSQLLHAATNMLAHWEERAEPAQRSAKGVRRPRWDVIVVDDIENAPYSIMAFMSQLQVDGAAIITAGDGDSCVQGFRGGIPSMPVDVCRDLSAGGLGADMRVLAVNHRASEAVNAVGQAIAGAIYGSSGVHGSAEQQGAVRQAACAPGADCGWVEGRTYANAVEEAAGIARLVREWHLKEGLPYGQVAIITRSRASHESLRAELVRRGVPVATVGSDRPLKSHSAVAALMGVIRLCVPGEGEGNEEGLAPAEQAEAVRAALVGPLFEANVVALERALRGLGGPEDGEAALCALACGDVREAWADACPQAARFAAVARSIRAEYEAGGGAERVLWKAWHACDVAEQWQDIALGRGIEAEAANENLDAIIQLFRFVERLAERREYVGILEALNAVEAQELPEDSVARTASEEGAVALLTPSAALGRQFQRVVIASVNEGTWPNLRVRNPLLQPSELVRLVVEGESTEVSASDTGARHRAALREVMNDELRQFRYAVGRARESVLITALEGEDYSPSRFLDLCFEEADEASEDAGQARDGTTAAEPDGSADASVPRLYRRQAVPPALDMTGIVGAVRKRRHLGDSEVAARAEGILAALAAKGVAEAQPALWFDEAAPTGDDGAGTGTGKVRISPSAVESLVECPLAGTFNRLGFQDASNRRKADIGTLIHELAEEFPLPDEGESDEAYAGKLVNEFEARYAAQFTDSSEWDAREGQQYREAVDRLAHWLWERAEENKELAGNVAVEQPFSFEEKGVKVSGYIDRIEWGADGARLIDFKTGKYPPNNTQVQDHPQLQLYQLALARDAHLAGAMKEHGGTVAEAMLVYPRKGDEQLAKLPQESIAGKAGEERALNRIRAAAQVQALDELPALDHNGCDRCRYRSICPLRPEGRVFS